MAYRWEPGAGSYSATDLSEAGLLPTFPDQQRAEDWLGLYFGDLAEYGVAEVSLYEEDRLVYGPMGLGA